MNTLLDITGAILYLALSIVLFPVFLLAKTLLFSVVLYRNGRAASRQLAKNLRKHHYHLPRIDMVLKKGWILLQPNRH